MSMLIEKLAGIETRYKEINQKLLTVGNDYKLAAALGKEKADLDPFIEAIEDYKASLEQLEGAQSLAESGDDEMRELADLEVKELKTERKGWKVEVLSLHETGVGGVKEVSAMITGKGAFSRLKYESGVHRVQRVPETESQGRIHTSTATVAVLAEVDDVDEVEIPPSDIVMDVYKAGGPGGQSVQKNSTAIRLTHKPTGIVVQCQDERSQAQNRARALSILKARLFEIEENKRHQEQAADRKSQIGSGDRSEKIRTYNFPQSRITDHRINYSAHQLAAVLDGEIDGFIEELSTDDEAKRLAEAGFED